ncbi:MAG: CBS domain-containing protein [Pseudohongiellaceae bacterium]
MYVNEIMTPQVITCTPDSSLEDIARLMWNNDCGSIPVINKQEKPIGVVTDRDIAIGAMLNHQPLWEIPASRIIQEQRICSSNQDDTVEDCLDRMEQNGVRRCLVTGQDGRLCGIVSMGDAVAFVAGRARTKGVPADNVLKLMRTVSAHHPSPQKPIARV